MVNEALELTEKEEETSEDDGQDRGGKAFCPTLGQRGTLSDGHHYKGSLPSRLKGKNSLGSDPNT